MRSEKRAGSPCKSRNVSGECEILLGRGSCEGLSYCCEKGCGENYNEMVCTMDFQ